MSSIESVIKSQVVGIRDVDNLIATVGELLLQYSTNEYLRSNKLCSFIAKLEPEVVESLNGGQLTVHDIFNGSVYDIIPRKRDYRDKVHKSINHVRKVSLTLYPCPQCGVRDHTMTEYQCRSLDENSTHFCVCNACAHTWTR